MDDMGETAGDGCLARAGLAVSRAAYSCGDVVVLALSYALEAVDRVRGGSGEGATTTGAGAAGTEMHAVQKSVVLDTTQHGDNVEVSRYCASGNGAALGNVDVDQESAYWEIEVVTPGRFCVGVAQPCPHEKDRSARFNRQLGDGQTSWALPSTKFDVQAKDTIGVYLDQRDVRTLRFSLNGEMLPEESTSVRGMRGDLRAAISVEQGTILKLRFDENSFRHRPAGSVKRFHAIIPARSVI
ncbi:SPRY domain-containing protein 7 [Hondaea fermentalgiana]|uniref:SPRY domain-containing protein 7 n=1 Tax=Hondaea fermentalgiana TaxID=2315210 RepID=A0A2R5GAW2_9STRA|nr:SPRY domain-containing protein 7 [Hondaea fermentalgiana]|eukprot:GBG28140.1 SPRY domain-containing protein 7 [Hondaea fermentalgiana]